MLLSPDFLPHITPSTALFLDFDGTLVALAEQPDLVQVPPGLTEVLAALQRRLDGALALVSGRPLADLDRFLAPLLLPAAAEHGARRRTADGHLVSVPAADLQAVLAAAYTLVQQHPLLRLERKQAALSLHYRQAPELQSLCLQAMQAAVRGNPDLDLMQGKCVIDIKPAAASKGNAIAAFLNEAPFRGRTPLFAGDDVTDEAGFAEVQQRGGCALKVGDGPTTAGYRCASVEQLAAWLHQGAAVGLAEAPA